MTLRNQENFPSLEKKPEKKRKEKAVEMKSDKEEAMETIEQNNNSKNNKGAPLTEKIDKPLKKAVDKKEETVSLNNLGEKILIESGMPQAEVNKLTKEEIREKIKEVLGEKKLQPEKEAGIPVKNIDRKEFTFKYWEEKAERFEGREKIGFLASAISRLRAIESFEGVSQNYKEKARKQIENIKKTIEELERENALKKPGKKEETKKDIEQKNNGPEKDLPVKEKKDLFKEEKRKAKAAFGKRLMSKGYSEEETAAILNSPGINQMIEDFWKKEKENEEKNDYEKLMERVGKMYDEAVELKKKKEAEEKEKSDKEARLKNLRSQMKELFNQALKAKDQDDFEIFRENIGDVEGKKYNHEAIRNAYLKKLGWSVKYDAFNSRAWLTDSEGNFINKEGSPTKSKKEKIEFKTQWRFPEETPFVVFLREQVKKRFVGSQEIAEKAKTEVKTDNRTEKQKKEDEKEWEKVHGPSGMADVWDATYGTPKKKKSFWQKLKEFWSG